MQARRWNLRVYCFFCTLLLQSIVAAVTYAPADAQRVAAGHVSAFQLAPFPLASSAQRDLTSRRKQTARRTCTHTTIQKTALRLLKVTGLFMCDMAPSYYVVVMTHSHLLQGARLLSGCNHRRASTDPSSRLQPGYTTSPFFCQSLVSFKKII